MGEVMERAEKIEKKYQRNQFASLLGKSERTLRRWDERGLLRAYRYPSGRPYYTHSQYLKLLREGAFVGTHRS